MSRRARRLSIILGVFVAAPAVAGPPYAVDDPQPTDLHHWEIYAFNEIEGRGGDKHGNAGFDLNYGPLDDVQLTATLPLAYLKDSGGWRSGRGDVELGIKYRFAQDKRRHFQVALFPRIILPTANKGLGSGRARLLLPIWAQEDVGSLSIFGGGGYELNPGQGNRGFWQSGAAATYDFGHGVTLGGEVTHEGADSDDSFPSTAIGIGGVIKLGGPFALLTSAGPKWMGGRTEYHAYAALGLNF